MLLINYGGNLNSLNNEGNTPLAYGDIKFLKTLNLLHGVCKVKRDEFEKFDNN